MSRKSEQKAQENKLQTQKLQELLSTNPKFEPSDALSLLKLGADPTVKNKDGQTLLHILLIRIQKEDPQELFRSTIRALIEDLQKDHDHIIDIKNNNGDTPLQALIKTNDYSIFDAIFLVQLGANAHVQDNQGNTLLHILVKKMPKDREFYLNQIKQLVKILGAHNIKMNIDIKNESGNTPLQTLISTQDFLIDDAMYLVELGADPTVQNSEGYTLLHILVGRMNGSSGIIYIQIKNLVKEYQSNIDINIKNRDGNTPLQKLISTKDFSIDDAMYLVELGADPTVQNSGGNTLLHVLVDRMDGVLYIHTWIKKLVEKLKENNSSINIINKANQTPLQKLMNRVDFSASHFLISQAMFLVDLGADARVQDYKGNTLLHILVDRMNGSIHTWIEKLVTKLKEHGSGINITNKANQTPLQKLMNRDNFSASHFLISQAMFLVNLGADARVQDYNGNTLLHILVGRMNGYSYHSETKELVKKLEEHKFNIDIKNSDGNTPLQKLINRGNFSIEDALFLVQLGADPTVQDHHGNTLLHILVGWMDDSPTIRDQIKNLVDTLSEKHKDIFKLKNRAGNTPLQKLIKIENFSSKDALFLVRLGADPTVKDHQDNTLLDILLERMGGYSLIREQITELVDKHKATIDIEKCSNTLQKLINRKQFSIKDLMFLIQLGADARVQDDQGNTLLHILVTNMYNTPSCVDEIEKLFKDDKERKEHNPIINTANNAGKTPLQLLIDFPEFHSQVAMYLVSLGATLDDRLLPILLSRNEFKHVETLLLRGATMVVSSMEEYEKIIDSENITLIEHCHRTKNGVKFQKIAQQQKEIEEEAATQETLKLMEKEDKLGLRVIALRTPKPRTFQISEIPSSLFARQQLAHTEKKSVSKQPIVEIKMTDQADAKAPIPDSPTPKQKIDNKMEAKSNSNSSREKPFEIELSGQGSAQDEQDGRTTPNTQSLFVNIKEDLRHSDPNEKDQLTRQEKIMLGGKNGIGLNPVSGYSH